MSPAGKIIMMSVTGSSRVASMTIQVLVRDVGC